MKKKERKKGFDPYLDRQKEDIFPSLNFFQSFSVTIEERREGEKNERYEREFGRKMRAGQVR